MGLKNSQYQTIMRSYEQKQLRSHDLLNSHYEDVYRVIPEFRALDESISNLSIRRGRQLLNGDEHAIDSLHEELSALRKRKKELLKAPAFRMIIWNPSMNAAFVKTPATSTIKSAVASKKLSLTCFTVSRTCLKFSNTRTLTHFH